MTDARKLNVACGTHYADGWVNTDVMRNADTRPDVIVTYEHPFPFEEAFGRVMLSHCLEHIPWADIDHFLEKLKFVITPATDILVIGPDFVRASHAWKAGQIHDALFFSVAEHSKPARYTDDSWPGARHWWNCSDDRVHRLLVANGFECDPIEPTAVDTALWPIKYPVDSWQFALEVRLAA